MFNFLLGRCTHVSVPTYPPVGQLVRRRGHNLPGHLSQKTICRCTILLYKIMLQKHKSIKSMRQILKLKQEVGEKRQEGRSAEHSPSQM